MGGVERNFDNDYHASIKQLDMEIVVNVRQDGWAVWNW